MKLQHLVTAGHLVQAVDVLGDNGFEFSLLFPLGQLVMGGIGPGFGAEQLLAVEVVKLLGVFFVKGVAEHGFRRILEFLVVQPVYAAEIPDTGLCADTGSAEKDNVVAGIYQFLQFANIFLHIRIPPV